MFKEQEQEQIHTEIEDETTVVRILSAIFIFFMIMITFSYSSFTPSSVTHNTYQVSDSSSQEKTINFTVKQRPPLQHISSL